MRVYFIFIRVAVNRFRTNTTSNKPTYYALYKRQLVNVVASNMYHSLVYFCGFRGIGMIIKKGTRAGAAGVHGGAQSDKGK